MPVLPSAPTGPYSLRGLSRQPHHCGKNLESLRRLLAYRLDGPYVIEDEAELLSLGDIRGISKWLEGKDRSPNIPTLCSLNKLEIVHPRLIQQVVYAYIPRRNLESGQVDFTGVRTDITRASGALHVAAEVERLQVEADGTTTLEICLDQSNSIPAQRAEGQDVGCERR